MRPRCWLPRRRRRLEHNDIGAAMRGDCSHPEWSVFDAMEPWRKPGLPFSLPDDLSDDGFESAKSTECLSVPIMASVSARGGWAPRGSRRREPVAIDSVGDKDASTRRTLNVRCSSCFEVGVVLVGPYASAYVASVAAQPHPTLAAPPRSAAGASATLVDDQESTEIDAESPTNRSEEQLTLRAPPAPRGSLEVPGIGRWVSPPGASSKRRKCVDCREWFECGRNSRSTHCSSCRSTAALRAADREIDGRLFGSQSNLQYRSSGGGPSLAGGASLVGRMDGGKRK